MFYKIRDICKNDPLALIIRILQLESNPEMLFETFVYTIDFPHR